MKKFFIISLLLLSTATIFSQEKLNQLNLEDDKQGFHEIYLNKNLRAVKDSSKASFKIIEYYANGKYHRLPTLIKSNYKIICDKKNSSKIKLEYMDGAYTIVDKKGKVFMELEYKNGRCIGVHKFYDKHGLYQKRDYTIHCEKGEYSFIVRLYDSKTGKQKDKRCLFVENNIWKEKILK